MRQAISDIPGSELTTSFDLPGNQMEPDDEVYGIIENGVSTGQLVDPDGMPIDGSQRMEDQPVDPRLDQQWLDRVLSRSEEHTSELQSLMRISYAVFCLKKKNKKLSSTETQTCTPCIND